LEGDNTNSATTLIKAPALFATSLDRGFRPAPAGSRIARMRTKQLALVLLVLVLLATTAAGWKWNSKGHKTARWADGGAQYRAE
jgi:hypothetical protein